MRLYLTELFEYWEGLHDGRIVVLGDEPFQSIDDSLMTEQLNIKII